MHIKRECSISTEYTDANKEEREEQAITAILENKKKIAYKEFTTLFYKLTRDEHYKYKIPSDPQEAKEDKENTDYDLLHEGNKYLSIMIFSNKKSTIVQTEIAADKSKDSIPGTTSRLYKAAKRIMQKEADARKQTIQYHLTTGNKNMIRWALNSGKSIFHWDKILLEWENPKTQQGERLDPTTLDLSNKSEDELYALFTTYITPSSTT